MQELTNNQKCGIIGGAITTTILNSFARLISTVYDLGRAVGSTIRRASSGKSCPLS